MQPQDVYRLSGVSQPCLSRDGRSIAYVVWRADRETNDYPSAIWIRDEEGNDRRVTPGTSVDRQPCWSPDGGHIAFTSNRVHDESENDKEKSQLYVLAARDAGAEPRRVTDQKEDVSDIGWSPDGTSLLFACRDPDDAYDEKDAKRRAPRRFTRLGYKLDDVGWTGDRPSHLFVVPAGGSSPPRPLTTGPHDDVHPVWSPDGTRVAFSSARSQDWDVTGVSDIYLVGSEGGDPRLLTHEDGVCEHPSWSPDGTRIAFLYTPGILDLPRHGQIVVVEVGSREVRVLTEALDRNCVPFPSLGAPVWDGDDLVFALEDEGNTHLYRVPADGSARPRALTEGALVVNGFDRVDGRLVYSATTQTSLSELYEEGRALTEATVEVAHDLAPIPAEPFPVTSKDGTPVPAWVMKPAGYVPGTRYPVLLNIHGGPFTQYGNGFFDEFQVYASAGYVVLFSNPRGSSGYSEEIGRAIRGPVAEGPGWGTVDYQDLMAVVDTALDRFDFCDAERVGVMGGSYGGYMTSWIVSHTDRFRTACSERAVNNWHSMHGSSDLGWVFAGYFGAPLWEAPEAYLDHSPITHAANISTPMLLLHSEDDLRCPIEQAEQLFTMLRLLKRDVELVCFPGEGHELTRSGSPEHRVQRFEIILDWFDRKLRS